MASTDTNPEIVGDNAAGTTTGDGPLKPIHVQNDGKFHEANNIVMSEHPATASEKLVGSSVAELVDVVQALNSRILELEKNANIDPESYQDEDLPPEVKADLEQRRKMESCLYKHRKEWEATEGPGNWCISDFTPRRYMTRPGRRWELSWEFESDRAFRRSDHFHPSHNCADGPVSTKDQIIDDFDRTIDYGSRRDRLRKTFEWEMDRLYLAEELEHRRQEKMHHRPEEKHQKDDESGNTQDALLPTFAKTKLNRVHWFSFKELSGMDEKDACVMDILIGEPDIDEDLGVYRLWYGSSHRRARKSDAPQDVKPLQSTTPGQSPLPERIRIHSAALSKILETLLGKTLDVRDESTFVLVRPFKALRYCEPGLRDWCAALEEKFRVASETGTAAMVTDDSIIEPSQDDPIPHHSETGQNPSPKPSKGELGATADETSSQKQGDQATIEPRDQHEQAKEEKRGEDEDESSELAKSPTAMEHLKCLLSFIDTDILARQEYLTGSDCRKVLFSDLWHLFRPGTEVIGNDGKQAYRVIKVTSAKHSVARDWRNYFNFPEAKRKKKAAFSITCVYIDFDGKHFGPVRKLFDIKRYDGERDITSLDVYPLCFYPIGRVDFGDLEWDEAKTLPTHQRYRQKLVRRGTKFLEVASVKHMYYAGPTLGVRDDIESQVVIDFETAFAVEDEAQKQWKPNLETLLGGSMAEEDEEDEEDEQDGVCHAECCRGDFVHDDSYVDQKQSSEYVDNLLPKAGSFDEQPSVAVIPRPLEELHSRTGQILISEDDLLIMSYRVFGFVLRNRKWAKLDLTYVTDVHRPEKPVTLEGKFDVEGSKEKKEPVTAFDRLVLEKWHRPMIESLIAQHFRDKQSTTGEREEFDIVKGKGKGLIMLLHGAPGVGKTSTAEGVAELFKKPLFQITCGDLGTTASEVEKALETNFALANRWDCILLLDEADVFLAERTKEDFRRNGLVAVFLRVMEYYAGILFLTTNRVGDFDEAFTSRIHVSLLYRELDSKKTIEVFKINMDMIEERFKRKGRAINIDRADIAVFASQHFTNYPKARWNGRQIRNACQTALALAEYEAHKKGHAVIPTSEAVVTLDVKKFEIVRDAYVEFTEYMNDLYKVDAAQRARDNQLRAIWTGENNRTVHPMTTAGSLQDQKKAEFLLAAQGPPPPSHPPQSPPTLPHQQQYPHRYQPQQPQQYQQYQQHQQQQEYYRYQDPNTPRSAWSDSSCGPPQTQHLPAGQVSNYPIAPVANTSFQGYGEEGKIVLPPEQLQRQPLGPPPHQRQPHENVQQQVINHGVHTMFEPPGQQPPNQSY